MPSRALSRVTQDFLIIVELATTVVAASVSVISYHLSGAGRVRWRNRLLISDNHKSNECRQRYGGPLPSGARKSWVHVRKILSRGSAVHRNGHKE